MILLNGIKPVGDGILFSGQLLECWLPSYMQPDIPYDPRKLPAIPVKTGFHRAHPSQPFPSDYIYVSSERMLITYWRKWKDFTVERR